MKVLCIDNSEKEFTLTVGKYYDVQLEYIPDPYSQFYRIINDMGHSHSILKSRFKTIEQIREEKLIQLGI